jgi:acyl carrier protein
VGVQQCGARRSGEPVATGSGNTSDAQFGDDLAIDSLTTVDVAAHLPR